MNINVALLYGVIQGITEFLPISSSGHLSLIPHFLGISDPGVLFDLSMHVGTCLAVLIYFFKDIKVLFLSLFPLVKILLRGQRPKGQEAFLFNSLFSVLMSIFFILLFKSWSERFGRSPEMMAFNLAIFGIGMFLADFFKKDTETIFMDKMDCKRSFFIGFFQALAIFPGVSRSGATLTISRLLGMGREESARFSFLLSLPLILGGFFYKLPTILKTSGEVGKVAFQRDALGVGVLISFIVGLATIHYFLKFIKRIGLWPFFLYRLFFSLFLLYEFVLKV